MLDWFMDRPALVISFLVLGFVGCILLVGQSEQNYRQELLGRARTFADTLQVERIMAERAKAHAIAFGAGMIAGSQSSR